MIVVLCYGMIFFLSPNFKKYYNIIHALYKNDHTYHDVVEKSALTYISHHDKDINTEKHTELAKDMCIKYILEESPLILPDVLSSDYIVYHSEPTFAMENTFRRLCNNTNLPWQSVHYSFEEYQGEHDSSQSFEKSLVGLSTLINIKDTTK